MNLVLDQNNNFYLISLGILISPLIPLNHLPSCYHTVCCQTVKEANHIQSCRLYQLNENCNKTWLFSFSLKLQFL